MPAVTDKVFSQAGQALTLRVVHSDSHRRHAPRHDIQGGVAFEHLERPARAERILAALADDARFSLTAPSDHGLAPIEAVHDKRMVDYLRDAWRAWNADTTSPSPEVIPDTLVHPRLRQGMDSEASVEPTAPIGRIGYWCFDTGTPIVEGTYAAALAAADVALTTSDLVLGGERAAYGLCRPPGHHAAHAVFGGFCYFNNAAIAAEYLVAQSGGKVAVLDLDYHHGNGTQQIFYRRSDVLYVSLHGDPLRAYPYFTGHADETGAGSGRGFTLNVPLPPAIDDEQYLVALDAAIDAVGRFRPDVSVISLGIDTYVDDPLGDFLLTTPVYADCGRRLQQAGRPLVVLQEGGYCLPSLGENVRQFLLGCGFPHTLR
jgi:acetoin utilization deacetylase AcuC-like enzyme